MAKNGIQPRRLAVGTSPHDPEAGAMQPEKTYNRRAYEWPRRYPSETVTAGLDPKSQFLITQGLQLKDTISDSTHKPVTPKNEVSYAESLQRKSYWR